MLGCCFSRALRGSRLVVECDIMEQMAGLSGGVDDLAALGAMKKEKMILYAEILYKVLFCRCFLKPFISSQLPKSTLRCGKLGKIPQCCNVKIGFRPNCPYRTSHLIFKLPVNLHNAYSLVFTRFKICERWSAARLSSASSFRPSTDCVVCFALSEMLWL